jgi:hypothetical protein
MRSSIPLVKHGNGKSSIFPRNVDLVGDFQSPSVPDYWRVPIEYYKKTIRSCPSHLIPEALDFCLQLQARVRNPSGQGPNSASMRQLGDEVISSLVPSEMGMGWNGEQK